MKTTLEALTYARWRTLIQSGVALSRVGGSVALQGNLDPVALFAQPARIRSQVAQVLAAYGDGAGHVFNLGHGVSQFTPPEHVGVLVEAVHELSRAYHAVP